MTKEQIEAFVPEKSEILVSQLVNNLKRLINPDQMRGLAATKISAYLIREGYVVEVTEGTKKPYKEPTEKGEALGLRRDIRQNFYGSYNVLLYDPQDQRFVAEKSDEIAKIKIPKKVEDNEKFPFSLSSDGKSKFEYSEEPVFASTLTGKLNDLLEDEEIQFLKVTQLIQWLLHKDLLKEEICKESVGKSRVPTSRGMEMGISTKIMEGKNGEYIGVFYNKAMQSFVVEHLEELVAYDNKEQSHNEKDKEQ